MRTICVVAGEAMIFNKGSCSFHVRFMSRLSNKTANKDAMEAPAYVPGQLKTKPVTFNPEFMTG